MWNVSTYKAKHSLAWFCSRSKLIRIRTLKAFSSPTAVTCFSLCGCHSRPYLMNYDQYFNFEKNKTMFLRGTASSSLDNSKCFTLHPRQTCSFRHQLDFSGKHSSTWCNYCSKTHIFPPLSMAKCSFIQVKTEWTEASWTDRKCSSFDMAAKEFEPAPYWELGDLLLSYDIPQASVCTISSPAGIMWKRILMLGVASFKLPFSDMISLILSALTTHCGGLNRKLCWLPGVWWLEVQKWRLKHTTHSPGTHHPIRQCFNAHTVGLSRGYFRPKMKQNN